MKPLLKDIKKQGTKLFEVLTDCHFSLWLGVRVVANAGGINSESCVKVLKELAQSQGIELSVAMVTGDDMMKSVCVIVYMHYVCWYICLCLCVDTFVCVCVDKFVCVFL